MAKYIVSDAKLVVLKCICCVFAALMLVGCGEDRTFEYEEATLHNIWIFEQMQDYYIHYESLKEQGFKDYFASPDAYFDKLRKMGTKDSWSYIVVDTIHTDNHARGYFNHFNSYGFDYELIQDPTGNTTKSFARVLTVYDGSSAQKAQLKRNDFIETYNGYKLSKNNIENLQKGIRKELTVRRFFFNESTQQIDLTEAESITLSESGYVEDKAFPVRKVLNGAGGRKVGYLMCNRLLDKPEEWENMSSDYSHEMDNAFEAFRNEKVNDLIIDFRLCNFGNMQMARRMASYVLRDDQQDDVFAMTKWNDNHQDKNEVIKFDSSLRGKTLGLNRIYFITSKYTQGAAEWVINALRYAMGEEAVVLVGQKTAGQNVMNAHCGDYYDEKNQCEVIHIYPAVAFVENGDGFCDFPNGFEPTIAEDEFSSYELLDYGDENEVLVKSVLSIIQ